MEHPLLRSAASAGVSLTRNRGGTFAEIRSFHDFAGLEFNLKSKVEDLMVDIAAVDLKDNALSIALSELPLRQFLKFPGKSLRCEITFALSLFRLTEGFAIPLAESQSVVVEKSDVSIGPFEFKFDVPAGCLCVVSLFLNYSTVNKAGWTIIKDKQFSPGCVCGAVVTSGKYTGNDQRLWTKMVKVI